MLAEVRLPDTADTLMVNSDATPRSPVAST